MRALWLALLLAPGSASARQLEPPLEGTAWKLLVDRAAVPDGLWYSDLLVFGRERFAALEYLNQGFSPGAYRSEPHGSTLRWTAALHAPGGISVRFDGVRDGRTMSGKLQWRDSDGRVLEVPWKAVPRPRPTVLPPGF